MSVSELSASAQNYLKAIWGLQEWSDEPVTTSMLAAKTGLKLSTVSGAMSKLTDQGLVEHTPYGSVTLTASGRVHALAMVRRHRLIETFLVQVLGYRWDQVHDEAEQLEHAVSDFLVDRLQEHLGDPTRDPHGDPIPSRAGEVRIPAAILLTEVPPGSRTVVARISDADPQMLRFFAEQRIVLDATLEVSPGAPYSGSIEVSVDGGAPVSLGRSATDAIWVSVR